MGPGVCKESVSLVGKRISPQMSWSIKLSIYELVDSPSLWLLVGDSFSLWTFNHTSWVAIVTLTDRPKSARNRCVIEVFGGVFCVVTLLLGFSCRCRGFCHRTESDLFIFLWARVETTCSAAYFRIFCWYRVFCHRTESDLLLFLLVLHVQ